MAAESDLMLALLALQMNFLKKEQLVEAGALWAQDRRKSLAGILLDKGFLNKAAKKALDGLLAVHMEQFGGGDAEKSLAALTMDEDVRQSLLALPLGEKIHGTLMEFKPGSKHSKKDAVETVVLAKTREERYKLGAEIGRGGLGRVVAGRDTVLGREVAVKEMLSGADKAELLKRFLREGEIAGGLLHPNIVPVFDIGVREEAGKKTPYFAMGMIHGRNLKDVIKAIEDGDADARREFTRPRLLRVFQDVCLAMTYAHDHGVIHRDLKPANVMVGKYGEVYVVDWGLAKVMGQKENSASTVVIPSPDAPAGPQTPVLTMEGTVLGTPAYMSPEQADGNIENIDARSDIYSLGAILYEMLTFRPPFEGATGFNVIAKVLSGELTPPSTRVSEIRRELEEMKKGEGLFPENIPPELESIVLKAMAKDKSGRFVSARELHDEVQLFLEREKKKEFNRQQAEMERMRAIMALDTFRQAEKYVVSIKEQLEKEGALVKPFWPAEKKARLWELERKNSEVQEEILGCLEAVERQFWQALTFEHDNPDVIRDFLAFCWERFLKAEDEDDKKEISRFRGIIESLDKKGEYQDRLKGDGSLAISTRFYPCKCLTEGRMVGPDETEVMGFHPFSGRALDGHEGAEGLPELEPKEPIRLKIHGPECRTEPLEGADVWLFRYEERGRVLVPVFPEGVLRGKRSAVSGEGKAVRDGFCEEFPADRAGLDGGGPDARGNRDGFGIHGTEGPGRDRSAVRGDDKDNPGYAAQDGGLTDRRSPLAAALDRLYGPGSPFRPNEGLYLGKTPIPGFKIPMGSYLLVIDCPGGGGRPAAGGGRQDEASLADCRPPVAACAGREFFSRHSALDTHAGHEYAPVRCPIFIARNGDESAEVTLYGASEIPEDFVQVPAGRFIYQGDRGNPYSGPKGIKETGDCFVAKFPVTCREYLVFLNDLAARDSAQAEKRAPRKTPTSGFYWPRDAEGRYHIPTEKWIAEALATDQANRSTAKRGQADQDWKKQASKLEMSPVWWDEVWPVFSVSWEDLAAFAAWRSKKESSSYCLVHDLLWEKAARGVDGRLFPHGDSDDASFFNQTNSHEGGMRPCPVDSFPDDESPYGVRGLAGNSRDFCLNDAGKEMWSGWRLARGGVWTSSGARSRPTSRTVLQASFVDYGLGGRLSWLPCCRTPMAK